MSPFKPLSRRSNLRTEIERQTTHQGSKVRLERDQQKTERRLKRLKTSLSENQNRLKDGRTKTKTGLKKLERDRSGLKTK